MNKAIRKIGDTNLNIIKNIVASFIIKGGSLIINILLLPSYMKFFNNEVVLGIWYTILSVLQWMTLFDLGLGNGLRNKLPGAIEQNDRISIKEYISTTYILMCGIALLVFIIGFVMIPILDWNSIFNIASSVVTNDDFIYCVRIVFAGIMCQIVLKIITSILYAMQKSSMVGMLVLLSNCIILISVRMIPSQDLVTNLKTMSWINAFAVNIPYILCSVVVFFTALKDVRPSLVFFRKKMVKDVAGIGISLLWLQLVFMVVSSTNELLITNFTQPENVVEYQAYNKIFHTGATLVSLALTPIWSAVTRAQSQNNYLWIAKVYKLFMLLTAGCFIIELAIIPLLQLVMDVWLGVGEITVSLFYAISFAVLSTIMILHNVNTSIGNGMSYFRLQMIWMTVAAVLFIPLSYILVNAMESWIGVIWSGIISLLPYEILAPIYTMKALRQETHYNSKQSCD